MKPITDRFREVRHVIRIFSRRSPPRPSIGPTMAFSHFWSQLTDEQRQRTLATLSGIVLRHLDALRSDEEVRDERS